MDGFLQRLQDLAEEVSGNAFVKNDSNFKFLPGEDVSSSFDSLLPVQSLQAINCEPATGYV